MWLDGLSNENALGQPGRLQPWMCGDLHVAALLQG